MTTAASPRRIDTAEVAKLIRRDIKRTFPGVKFSVRSERYAGGSSITVKWADGPTRKQVREFANPYTGKRFDGSIDLEYRANQWYCTEHGVRVAETYGHGNGHDGVHASRCCAKAELVHMGAGYINEVRELSAEFTAELEAAVAKEWGVDEFDANRWIDGQWMSNLLYRKSEQTPR